MVTDSRIDTYEHIHHVQALMIRVIERLQQRLLSHDATKLHTPEVELFDKLTSKLTGLEFGSDEYKASLEELGPALEHHYSHNSHHPQFYAEGIKGMSLLDLLEMFCDWMASTRRMANGDIYQSIDIQQERFGYSDELRQILVNTVAELQ